jgi:hypothetical protein
MAAALSSLFFLGSIGRKKQQINLALCRFKVYPRPYSTCERDSLKAKKCFKFGHLFVVK